MILIFKPAVELLLILYSIFVTFVAVIIWRMLVEERHEHDEIIKRHIFRELNKTEDE